MILTYHNNPHPCHCKVIANLEDKKYQENLYYRQIKIFRPSQKLPLGTYSKRHFFGFLHRKSEQFELCTEYLKS